MPTLAKDLKPTLFVDHSIASKLAEALLANNDFADFHNLVNVKTAVELIHSAGLSTVFIPYADRKSTSKHVKWDMMLCVVDRGACDYTGRWKCNADKVTPERPATLVYSMTRCVPMTEYVGDLFTCNLAELWYAANDFFQDVSYMLLGEHIHISLSGGRSHWGNQYRSTFKAHFDRRWGSDTKIQPQVELNPDRLRFESAPLLPDWDLVFPSNK